MAHFAKLDDNNAVLEVHVVSNDALDSSNEEASGIAFLTEWSGGHSNWKQTSYNGTFRKQYAGVGYTYNPLADVFIAPQPFASWSLDTDSYLWEAPVAQPADGKIYEWDESTLSWKEIAA
jgi:hypothetical protein